MHFESLSSSISYFDPSSTAPMITYESDISGHYLCKANCRVAQLPILQPPTIQVGVANGSKSTAIHIRCLPVPQLSEQASEVLGYVQDDNTNVIYNDCPAEWIRQVIEYAVSDGEPLLSDGNRKQKKSS